MASILLLRIKSIIWFCRLISLFILEEHNTGVDSVFCNAVTTYQWSIWPDIFEFSVSITNKGKNSVIIMFWIVVYVFCSHVIILECRFPLIEILHVRITFHHFESSAISLGAQIRVQFRVWDPTNVVHKFGWIPHSVPNNQFPGLDGSVLCSTWVDPHLSFSLVYPWAVHVIVRLRLRIQQIIKLCLILKCDLRDSDILLLDRRVLRFTLAPSHISWTNDLVVCHRFLHE
jgi:hypothetical protein